MTSNILAETGVSKQHSTPLTCGWVPGGPNICPRGKILLTLIILCI